MALGGGTFSAQNKVLPGSYINFVSTTTASNTLSDRGYVTMPLELDWGKENEVFEITAENFSSQSLEMLGYASTSENLKGLRDLFLNATVLYAYRLNGGGTKASNDFATAKYGGTRGNDLKVVIAVNADNEDAFDVSLYLNTTLMDSQTVEDADELISNDWVVWDTTATLAATAGTALTGGTNATVTATNHQKYINLMESYSYNILAVCTSDSDIKALYTAFVKRMRDEVGMKFQLVLHDYSQANYEGVISVTNTCTDDSETSLVYWVAGALAGCLVQKSCLNKEYDGEFTIDSDYTQAELSTAITNGEFILHKVGSDTKVLSDINTLVTTTDTKGEIFKDNMTIRIIDQIASDVATLFNTKYIGTINNTESGRISLWSDIVKIHENLQEVGAIEDFSDSDVTVSAGETKKSVVISDTITVANAMEQLYMSVEVA